MPASPTSQQQVAIDFNERINAGDLDGLVQLITEDHTFMDTLGNMVNGKPACRAAWKGFSAFPDYRNLFEEVATRNDRVIVTGRSTCSDARLAGPALWSAKIKEGKVHEWRVWSDTPANRAALGL
jgi:ketosteroid isomerase-like protein